MVKMSKLPGEDKHPNKSTIIINDDKVKLYLFADGFHGINALVGNMELSNIFIDDRRESYHLPKPLGLTRTIDDYKNFFRGMVDEYNRHYYIRGSSYVEIEKILLYRLFRESVDLDKASLDIFMENPSHLLDVANFAMFLYARITDKGYKE